MSKYIKLYDAIMAMDEWFSEPITPTKILSDLPTIEVSEDCISREWVKGICENMLDEEMLEHMLGHIEDAPSVVPSRAEGEWLFKKQTDDYHITGQCSNCKERSRINNYCPNCGAKMKGERYGRYARQDGRRNDCL